MVDLEHDYRNSLSPRWERAEMLLPVYHTLTHQSVGLLRVVDAGIVIGFVVFHLFLVRFDTGFSPNHTAPYDLALHKTALNHTTP